MAQLTDQQLIDLFKEDASRNKAFELIMQRYQQRIYWLIRKMVLDHDETNDLVQNTFIKAWQALDSFRAESQLYTWLYKIASNEALGFLRQKRKRFFIPIHDISPEMEGKLSSNAGFTGNEMELKLQRALLTLPDKQRLVFNMKYFDDLKYDEISEILGTSVGALKASYHLAVKKIEKILSPD